MEHSIGCSVLCLGSPGLHMWGWLSLQLQYPHFLGSGGRQPPAARVSILGPAPVIIRCRAQLLAPANPQQHWRQFPHSINYPHFISSFPSGALVVRKCMINSIHFLWWTWKEYCRIVYYILQTFLLIVPTKLCLGSCRAWSLKLRPPHFLMKCNL